MVTVSCRICKTRFYGKPSHIKRGWAKYCSKKCATIGQHTGKEVFCNTCKARVYRTPKELRCSKSNKFYCNRACFAIWKNQNMFFGEQHANWKDGKNAYRNVLLRAKVQQVCKGCGYDNKKVLLVHHIDRNRKNNVRRNLMWLCRNCHYLIHNGRTV